MEQVTLSGKRPSSETLFLAKIIREETMKTALILIDFINEIVDEKGKFAGKGYPAFVKAHSTLESVSAVIAKARAKNMPVIFQTLKVDTVILERVPPSGFQKAVEFCFGAG